jgi:hypothetical protein
MRLLQTYHISGKPATMHLAKSLNCRLEMEVNADKSKLSKYLVDIGAVNVGTHIKPLSNLEFDYYVFSLPASQTDYYHLQNLTLKVESELYAKDWMIEGKTRNLPQGVNLTIDLFGNGSAKMRQDIRGNVFGKQNRRVIR